MVVVLSPAAVVVACAYLVTMMLSMGLELGEAPKEDRHAKRLLNRMVIRALGFNLVLLPLVAVTLTRVLHASGDVAIALLLLAACPGGRYAPALAKAAGADLGLSVETALFLNKLVSFTAPLTARWMLAVHRIEIHELSFIAQLLLLQLLPYLLGKRLRHRRGELAARLERPVRFACRICLAVLLVLVVVNHRLRGFLLLPWDRGWLAVITFAPLALALGWLLGGAHPPARRAFAIGAIARDLALALLLAHLAFGQRAVPLATFLVWFVLLGVDGVFVLLVRRRPGSAERASAPALEPA